MVNTETKFIAGEQPTDFAIVCGLGQHNCVRLK
jgi:hypothetical protein